MECTSGHPDQVGYSDTPRSTGVAMGRAWARAWVVWGDMTQRPPRTCERTCAVARSTAVAVRAAWRRNVRRRHVTHVDHRRVRPVGHLALERLPLQPTTVHASVPMLEQKPLGDKSKKILRRLE